MGTPLEKVKLAWPYQRFMGINVMKKLSIVFIYLLLVSTVSYADSIRQKSMGNTRVATRSDAAVFQTNPAKLGLVKKGDLSLFRGYGGASADIFSKYSDLLKVRDANTNSEQIAKLKALVPMDVSGSFSVSPWVSSTQENFGITLYSRGQFSGQLNRKTSPKLNFSGDVDTSIMVGFSQTREFMGQDVIIGIAPKLSHQLVFYDKTTGQENMVFNQSSLLKGINSLPGAPKIDQYSLIGMGVDLGFLIPYESGKGAWGVSIENAISSYTGTKPITNQADQDVNTRAPLKLSIGSETDMSAPVIGEFILAADYDIYTEEKNTWFQTYSFGC